VAVAPLGLIGVVAALVPSGAPLGFVAILGVLALIPIAREVFWGPMAFAMMGGIVAGTAITLLFLPALYVTWFRIKEPKQSSQAGHSGALPEGGAA
jgi:multidrug efflux pump subunit AcrB